jgi:RNA polymerase primary sigma factor/RNA polymerase sigma factor
MIEDLAQPLELNTRASARWRQQGFVSRPTVFDGQKPAGFRQGSVDGFIERNREKASQRSGASRLRDEEVGAIVSEARDLATSGSRPEEILSRLSTKYRSDGETIRAILRQHCADLSESVPTGRRTSLASQTKEEIFQRYRTGESVDSLANRFVQPKSRIRRTVRDLHYDRIKDLNLDYIPNSTFEQVSRAKERTILAAAPDDDNNASKVRLPGGLPSYLESMYHVPLLTREQEAHLFRKMNYLKYKAGKLRDKLDPKRPKQSLVNKIQSLYDEALVVKNELVRRNLRLVASIAKRFASATETFFDLISDGNITLMRAVDKFDFSRGFKFSTYATWAIRRDFARSIPSEFRHRERFNTGCDDYLDGAAAPPTDQFQEELRQSKREDGVRRVLECLDDRERSIISDYFGLSRGQEPVTLKTIGNRLGISKERVRQLKARAIDKMRVAATTEKVELPTIEA